MKDETICCHGECLQGRSCPYREACNLEDMPQPKRDWAFEFLCWVAGVVTVMAVVVGVAA